MQQSARLCLHTAAQRCAVPPAVGWTRGRLNFHVVSSPLHYFPSLHRAAAARIRDFNCDATSQIRAVGSAPPLRVRRVVVRPPPTSPEEEGGAAVVGLFSLIKEGGQGSSAASEEPQQCGDEEESSPSSVVSGQKGGVAASSTRSTTTT